jgi:hypothetical protein
MPCHFHYASLSLFRIFQADAISCFLFSPFSPCYFAFIFIAFRRLFAFFRHAADAMLSISPLSLFSLSCFLSLFQLPLFAAIRRFHFDATLIRHAFHYAMPLLLAYAAIFYASAISPLTPLPRC